MEWDESINLCTATKRVKFSKMMEFWVVGWEERSSGTMQNSNLPFWREANLAPILHHRIIPEPSTAIVMLRGLQISTWFYWKAIISTKVHSQSNSGVSIGLQISPKASDSVVLIKLFSKITFCSAVCISTIFNLRDVTYAPLQEPSFPSTKIGLRWMKKGFERRKQKGVLGCAQTYTVAHEGF